MPLGMELGISPGDFVLDGDPAPLPKKVPEPPKFLAHVYCGQTAGWIKMALAMEVGIQPLVHSRNLPKIGEGAGSMKTPVGAEVDLSPGHIVLDGVPALRERAQQPPSFPPVSIVAAFTHLSYC